VNTTVMFSAAKDDWATPQDLFATLHVEFQFEWDAAANVSNAKCGGYAYFGPDHRVPDYQDALKVDWYHHTRRRFWLNPPYSRCREFVAKAAAEAKRGALVVALVPARTDTRWFHDYVWDGVRHQARPGVEVRFLRGRLKFGDAKNSAPFPSMLVVFRP
jgi:phage N-6-adenine-methyltransferase